ncbi:hypothetical protein [Stieleria mannarensis]|uniref:hypothetical protein n=1 Tax=Stieleria mannarensis TaxID=2755585 RepID=UPI0016001C1F|nr:hypothetical protein [Rhodopirellula sp. JC639]
METLSPYSPPAQTEESQLTDFQKAVLRNVLIRRNSSSQLRFVLRQWPAIVGYAVISGSMFIMVFALVSEPLLLYLMAAFSLGFFVASVASIFGECIRQFRIWPAMDRVIDWDVLQRLVE